MMRCCRCHMIRQLHYAMSLVSAICLVAAALLCRYATVDDYDMLPAMLQAIITRRAAAMPRCRHAVLLFTRRLRDARARCLR